MRLVKLTRAQWMGTGVPPETSDIWLNPEHVVSVEPAPGTRGGTRIGTINGPWLVAELAPAVAAALTEASQAPTHITQGVVSGPGTVGVHIGAQSAQK